jgi:PAS domain S-box-containing protein
MQSPQGNRQHRLKVFGLIAGLFLVAALVTAFTVAALQIQAAATAYVSGQSAWSRAELDAVYHLDAYAERGRPADLADAREALSVPLGDRQARLAMERDPLDAAAARKGLRSGQNHPDDIGRMIWLYRHFSDSPVFRESVRVWRESDSDILALAELADRLEAQWTADRPSLQAIAVLRDRLAEINQRLDLLTQEFRRAMAGAARLVAQWLTIASMVFLLTLALIAWLLGWRLIRTITAAERKFRTTFEKAAVGMAQMDRQGDLIDVNPALCGILGYSPASLQGQRYWDLVHPEDRDIGRSQREQMLAGTLDSYTLEHRLFCRHSDTVWGKLTVSRMHDDVGSGARYVAILEDVSESRRLSVELSYQANHDALTGLPNRCAFERSLAEILRQARTEDSTHALGSIDLDQFKIINDTPGHAAAYQLLR